MILEHSGGRMEREWYECAGGLIRRRRESAAARGAIGFRGDGETRSAAVSGNAGAVFNRSCRSTLRGNAEVNDSPADCRAAVNRRAANEFSAAMQAAALYPSRDSESSNVGTMISTRTDSETLAPSSWASRSPGWQWASYIEGEARSRAPK